MQSQQFLKAKLSQLDLRSIAMEAEVRKMLPIWRWQRKNEEFHAQESKAISKKQEKASAVVIFLKSLERNTALQHLGFALSGCNQQNFVILTLLLWCLHLVLQEEIVSNSAWTSNCQPPLVKGFPRQECWVVVVSFSRRSASWPQGVSAPSHHCDQILYLQTWKPPLEFADGVSGWQTKQWNGLILWAEDIFDSPTKLYPMEMEVRFLYRHRRLSSAKRRKQTDNTQVLQ